MEKLDELSPLVNFHEFITGMLDMDWLELNESITIEKMHIYLPVELEFFIDEDSSVKFNAGAPTQLIETSFMPVFHSMRIKVIGENGKKR